MHKFLKQVSIGLIFILFFTLLPIPAIASELKTIIDTNKLIDAPPIEQSEKKEADIIGEVIGKRGKNVKHFLKEDMSIEENIYPTAVHYLSDGKWKDIDNSLKDNKDENNNDILENKDNEYKIKVAKNTESNKLIRIQKDKYEVSWNIENAQHSLAQVKSADGKAADSKNKLKKNILTNLTSTINFLNIFQNTDIQYIIAPEDVKENIILNQRIEDPQYIFNINTKSLTAKLQEDNCIIFYDEKDTTKAVFKIEKPVMYDSNHGDSNNIKLILDKSDIGYKLTIIPDNEWLQSLDRVYPVIIDPQISTTQDKTTIQDTYVSEANPTTNYGNDIKLKAGIGRYRTFINFDLPPLTSSDMVIGAYFYAALLTSNPAPRQINVHKVNANWSETGITWGNMPGYNEKIQDYQLVQNTNTLYGWDITDIVKSWYVDGNKYGIMLKGNDETVGQSEFISSDTTSEYQAGWPQVVIQYTSSAGLEDYWTYHSQSVGRAGTGYVNDYNGNLVFVHNDLSMNGNRMPVTIDHVYNSSQSEDIGYGTGWRLNLSQRVEPLDIGTTRYYVYTDEDGTKHYFSLYDSDKYAYIDESGKHLILVISPDGEYTIKDKFDNQINFSSAGYLLNMRDNKGNTLYLTYNGTTLYSARDGVGRITTFEFTNGKLSGIIDPSQRKTSFEYTDDKLINIVYPDAARSGYGYNTDGTLKSASNNEGYRMEYSYFTGQAKRISNIKETGSKGATGQWMDLLYGTNSTIFTDALGRKNIYQFNDSGNTMSIRDAEGSAQYYKYFDDKDNKNRLSNTSKLQKTIINYLKNHNAEAATDWTAGYYTGSTGTGSFDGTKTFLGKQSLKIYKSNTTARQYFGQTLTLTKGKTYTFSAYVATDNIPIVNNAGAGLFLVYYDKTGNPVTVDSKFVNGNKDWQRLEIKFTVPADSADPTVYARAGITGNTGNAWFDALQLEEGTLAKRYNLIENSDFKYGTGTPLSWTKNSYTDANDTLLSAIQNDPGIPGLDRSAFRINGASDKSKALYQVVNVSGTSDDTFVIGGWARGDSVSLSSGRYFALDVGFKKPDGTFEWHVVPYNEDSSDWQYVEEKIALTPPVNPDDPNNDPSDPEHIVNRFDSIYVYAIYYNNANTVYFDGIQMYKEGFGQSYRYDGKGNMTNVTESANLSSNFEYETNNELLKYIDPKGNQFNYQYFKDGDSNPTHKLEKATTAMNVVYSFTYDSYGNPQTASVGDLTSSVLTSSAEYNTGEAYSGGNYIKSLTGADGNKISFNYDEKKGTLDSVTDGKENVTSYVYNQDNDRLDSASKGTGDSEDGTEIVAKNEYSYENDRIKTITHNGFNYVFDYDEFGNTKTVYAGDHKLIDNSYEVKDVIGKDSLLYKVNTGKLLSSSYGNNSAISWDYDNLDRVKTEKYNGEERYKFEYDGSGNLGYHEDLVNEVNYRYFYDFADRLARVSGSNDTATSFEYDLNNNLSRLTDIIGSAVYSTGYAYDKDNKNTEVVIDSSSNKKIKYEFDSIGRIKSVNIVDGKNADDTDKIVGTYMTYSYNSGGRIESIAYSDGSTISYTYDKNGNIETITEGTSMVKYSYNNLDELKGEEYYSSEKLVKKLSYSYDTGGNIKEKSTVTYSETGEAGSPDVISYSYNDPSWKDLLTSYNGQNLSYDEIGNLTGYAGYTYTWEGRELGSISGNGLNLSFKYNSDGIRTEKADGNKITKYYLTGDQVNYQETIDTSSNTITDKMHFIYDAAGKLVSVNLDGIRYEYIRNTQGDITGLMDMAGNKVVSYSYDAWGKLESIDGSLKDSLGVKNPYRYRGYRYDTETGLYYLQSRYYNPEWGRFINADGIIGQTGELLGHDLFTYTKNNPVNASDPNGFMTIEGAGVGGYSINRDSSFIQDTTTSILTTGAETASDYVPDTVTIFDSRALRKTHSDLHIEVKGAKAIKGGGTFIGTAGTVYSSYQITKSAVEYRNKYSFWEAVGRQTIDALVFIGGMVAAGIVITLEMPVIVGAAVTIVAGAALYGFGEGIKYFVWDRRRL